MKRKSRECLERLFDQWQSSPQICTVCRQDDDLTFSEESADTPASDAQIPLAPSPPAITTKETQNLPEFHLWCWLVEGVRHDRAAAVLVLSLFVCLVFLACFVSACMLFGQV